MEILQLLYVVIEVRQALVRGTVRSVIAAELGSAGTASPYETLKVFCDWIFLHPWSMVDCVHYTA